MCLTKVQQSVAIETVDEAQKLLEGTESKMEKHLRDWADKWRDTLQIMEVLASRSSENILMKIPGGNLCTVLIGVVIFFCFQENDLGLHKHRSTLRINMDPPHLVLLDDDPLNTSITIFSLKVSLTFQNNIICNIF